MNLFEIFEIPNTIKVEILIDSDKEIVIYSPEENLAIFYFSIDSDTELSTLELISRLKLGVSYHPLFATLFFEKATTENEEYAIGKFYYLVSPLLDAWAYREMLKYLPLEKVREIFNVFVENYQMLELKRMMGEKIPDMDLIRINLSGHLIARLLGFSSEVVFTGGEDLDFQEYVAKLENLSQGEPDINLLIELAKEYLPEPEFDITIKDNVISIKENISFL